MRLAIGLAVAITALGVASATSTAHAAIGSCTTQPHGGFGTAGGYATRTLSLPHPTVPVTPTRPNARVTVVAPAGGPGRYPVILWSHAYGATEPAQYMGLMEQLASNGYVVIHSSYQTPPIAPFDSRLRYDQLWVGFAEAVRELHDDLGMDLTRVGFAGHSFGGAATPEMFKRGVTQRGWGAKGTFIAVFAPYRVEGFSAQDAAAVPRRTKLLVEVYDDDVVNDHRIAIEDIWKPLARRIRPVDRDYALVHTAERGACALQADHVVPIEVSLAGGAAVLDDYDVWAVRRKLHGIAACAFKRHPRGCKVSIGRAGPLQAEMGRWLADGKPVDSLESLRRPHPTNCGEGEPCQFPHSTNPYH